MADVEYMHLCDYTYPAEGGRPCIIGIFQSLVAASFPCIHPAMCIAVQMRGAPHEMIPFVIELTGPTGTVINRFEATANGSAEGGAFIATHLVNVAFAEPGRHIVTVSSGGRPLATQTLRIRKLQPAGDAQLH